MVPPGYPIRHDDEENNDFSGRQSHLQFRLLALLFYRLRRLFERRLHLPDRGHFDGLPGQQFGTINVRVYDACPASGDEHDVLPGACVREHAPHERFLRVR